VAARRAILSRYFQAIVIRPTSARGRAGFDYAAVEPVWKDSSAPDPAAITD